MANSDAWNSEGEGRGQKTSSIESCTEEWTERNPVQIQIEKNKATLYTSDEDLLAQAGLVAPTPGEKEGSIDPVISGGLENPRERMNVLKFEDELLKFIKSSQQDMILPPISSYHRLLVYRLAQRFHLAHQALDTKDGSEVGNKQVLIQKTPECRIPGVLLIDLTSEETQEGSNDERPKIRLMKRNDSKTWSDEREKEYAKARARIFGHTDEIESQESSDSLRGSLKDESETVNREAYQRELRDAPGRSMGYQARGPNSSPAFGRGRRPERQTSDGGGMEEDAAAARRQRNDRKATWRNRRAELADPDFNRNLVSYQPTINSYGSMDNHGHGRRFIPGAPQPPSMASMNPGASYPFVDVPPTMYYPPSSQVDPGVYPQREVNYRNRNVLLERDMSGPPTQRSVSPTVAREPSSSGRSRPGTFRGSSMGRSEQVGAISSENNSKSRDSDIIVRQETYNEDFPPLS